ncbi:MAG: cytochrome c1 [Alphaproteobacteria bacterium]|nr:cytochrome c1 [Alphaproteobacteria bacterium]
MRRVAVMKATAFAAGLALSAGLMIGTAEAAGEAPTPPSQSWSFTGFFGTIDRASAQRGFQVYKEVCAGCHSIKYLAFRELGALGFSEDEIKAIAAEYEVEDGPDDEGEMFTRAAIAADRFPMPFPNDKAAAAANGGALPPDLSLIVKARGNGANYLHALLTGYVDPPADFELADGMNYNAWFPGHQIAMAQPLYGDDVEFADGTEASIDQQSRDLVTFLTWVGEPELEDRNRIGRAVIFFLIVLTALFWATKRKIWADVEH